MKMNNLLSVKNIIIAISTTLLLSHMANAQCDESCLPQGIGFFTQDDVDNFRNNYPGCTVIEGAVGIMGNEITNLDGLSVLTEIEGDLQVSASNLQNLHLTISGCSTLTDLTAFSSLTAMNGSLFIAFNDNLESLSGLDNINYEDLSGLTIFSNPMLSQCAVNSVCGYVTNNTPTGSDGIGDNAAGCNSWDQVQEACLEISVCENEFTSFSVYPNPGNNYISINNSDMEINSLIIFDHNGNIVLEKLISNTQFVVDIRGLSGGIYQVLISGKGTARKKLVIL